MLTFLLTNIRRIVYIGAFAFGALLIILAKQEGEAWQAELIGHYAITAVGFLYLTLLASPLYATFPKFPFRAVYIKARKALGISAFFFALTHATLAFFLAIGGFTGLASLQGKYLVAIILADIALCILAIMALTSLPYFIAKLGRFWKPLHRLVYIASVFILIHATLMGSDLTKPGIFLVAVAALLVLEAIRIGKYIARKLLARSRQKSNPPTLST